MNNKTCGNCKHFYDYEDRKAPCCWSKPTDNACLDFEPKVITNGDKIRQMSNEELADYLSDSDVHACAKDSDHCKEEHWNCRNCWLEYLNKRCEK